MLVRLSFGKGSAHEIGAKLPQCGLVFFLGSLTLLFIPFIESDHNFNAIIE